jgi:hypothetical protein
VFPSSVLEPDDWFSPIPGSFPPSFTGSGGPEKKLAIIPYHSRPKRSLNFGGPSTHKFGDSFAVPDAFESRSTRLSNGKCYVSEKGVIFDAPEGKNSSTASGYWDRDIEELDVEGNSEIQDVPSGGVFCFDQSSIEKEALPPSSTEDGSVSRASPSQKFNFGSPQKVPIVFPSSVANEELVFESPQCTSTVAGAVDASGIPCARNDQPFIFQPTQFQQHVFGYQHSTSAFGHCHDIEIDMDDL